MSGIAGIVHLDGKSVQPVRLRAMAEMQRHRGPDDEGYLLASPGGDSTAFGGKDTSPEVFHRNLRYTPEDRLSEGIVGPLGYMIGLAHRRLSIIDLSPAGHQPLCNESGDIWIVCDGRIYNSQNLRTDLLGHGHHFVSGSDTEVVLHAYEEWGEDCVKRFNGVWAFAIWDGRERKLFCCRDRFGIKPFHYHYDGKRFVFASEIAPLMAAGVSAELDGASAYLYLGLNRCDWQEHTFYAGVKRLLPSHSMTLDLTDHGLHFANYWSLERKGERLRGEEDAKAEEFRTVLFNAVRLRARGEALAGFSLSGGLDSSSIVCVASALGREETGMDSLSSPRTFSVRYPDFPRDEGYYVDAVVEKAHCKSTLVWPSGESLIDDLSELIRSQEEPIATIGAYGSWMLCEAAQREGVRVLLDGSGADGQMVGAQYDLGAYLGYLV